MQCCAITLSLALITQMDLPIGTIFDGNNEQTLTKIMIVHWSKDCLNAQGMFRSGRVLSKAVLFLLHFNLVTTYSGGISSCYEHKFPF